MLHVFKSNNHTTCHAMSWSPVAIELKSERISHGFRCKLQKRQEACAVCGILACLLYLLKGNV